MEEYLNKLLSQIRCKKARPFLDREIRGHIEDQIEDNLASGMNQEEAERMAISDMGDPVEVGVSLDKIHRPRMSWGIVVIVVLISIIGAIVRCSVIEGAANGISASGEYTHVKAMIFVRTLIGLGLMCIIYYLDYTRIAKWARLIGSGILLLGIYGLIYVQSINGIKYYSITIAGITGINILSIMALYIPIYGGILYKYRGKGLGGLIASIIWMIVPVYIVRSIPNLSQAIIMLICMMIQLTIAISKGWFSLPRRRTIAAVWGIILVLPVICMISVYSLHMLKPYQEARINAYLDGSSMDAKLGGMIRQTNQEIEFIGKSSVDIMSDDAFDGYHLGYYCDYSMMYILHTYGAILGLIIVGAIGSLVVYIFSSAMKQKNEVGLVMGCGSGVIILMNMLLNLLVIFGLFPYSMSYFPFISSGNSNMFLCYILTGIVLSIYRYKDIYPRHIRMARKGTN